MRDNGQPLKESWFDVAILYATLIILWCGGIIMIKVIYDVVMYLTPGGN